MSDYAGMKKILLTGILCALLAGCDYTVPLVTTPTIHIDRSALGLWQRTVGKGKTQDLLILPLSDKEYLISFPAGAKNAMFARACLWRGDGLRLVQVDWFGTARAKLPKDDRTYQYASYAIDGDTLTVRLLNPQVVPKDVNSTKALVKAIEENRHNPNLFRDAMVFRRVKQ